MRYYLEISLNGRPLREKKFNTSYVDEYLTVKKVFDELEDVFLQTSMYNTVSKSILEKNWEIPYYYNDQYFIFLGGHVLYRLAESEINNILVPTPKDVLQILLSKKDDNYKYLKGSYYFLLFDRLAKKIVIYSSPFYLFPAFFKINNGVLIFSNVIELILRKSPKLELNEQGLVEFSLFDHTIENKTIYKNIYTITGGKRIDITNDSISEKIVYDISKWIHRNPKKRKDSLYRINYVLKKVINNYVANVKKFNISLTGGFDGRLNFSMIDPYDYNKLQAFSYGMPGSLQISIPEKISKIINFRYFPVRLDSDFEKQYAELGYKTILVSGGITPFIRANYLYAYNKIINFSRNCIIGQCDLIRPLYKNPAGVIFNEFSQSIFFDKDFKKFLNLIQKYALNSLLRKELYSKKVAERIFEEINDLYINKYRDFSDKERFFLFLYKESMIKFWQTECHVVDLNVDDFISFSDLDYVEELASSQYFGLYKGIFAKNQFQRRKAHDLYIDLMTINNNKLNKIITDRFFKPMWLKYGILGYIIAFLGKRKSIRYYKKVGNDTFAETVWANLFYMSFKDLILKYNSYFKLNDAERKFDSAEYRYRYNRIISLKLWLDKMGIN